MVSLHFDHIFIFLLVPWKGDFYFTNVIPNQIGMTDSKNIINESPLDAFFMILLMID